MPVTTVKEKLTQSEFEQRSEEPERKSQNVAADSKKVRESTAVSASKKNSKEQKPLFGYYDIFNSRAMWHSRFGKIRPGEYYWGSLEVGEDRQLRFFVDQELQAKLMSHFSEVNGFGLRGELSASGDLSRIYFATPHRSGFLFSGSIQEGAGLTSLLPPYYQGQLVHVRFVRRTPLAAGKRPLGE